MIVIKSQKEIQIMREAAKVTAHILDMMQDVIQPGITTAEIDRIAEKEIRKYNMIPAFKGYGGFPAAVCTSVNEQIVHGIPSNRKLKEGDIISLDTGTIYKGYYSDAARTYPVGEISPEAEKLIRVTKESFFEGLKFCKPGYRLGDVSNAIQTHVERNGFSVVKDFVGHGIGNKMHEAPQIPNYGSAGRGPRLAPGMTLAIEPMVNQGTDRMKVLDDEWTAVSLDGSLSAHYENTVVITDGEPEILTVLSDGGNV